MPPKVHDTRPSAEEIEAVEAETALNARRIVATYAEDFFDGVTLMCMLGVEPEGLVHRKVAEEVEQEQPPKKATKKATKKAAKKATKATKKSTKKTTKKAAKKATKKSTKKTTKKTAKKA
ncbi:hypothetical protein [Corynebacterium uterequi]|uniref:Uncharacterized protein n=1 Tax=Corynebacterium uterequi TaxID=1072256 RepID=A0A0G3HGF8_9CORY|nr:hypothetical protein [Corynebacterium uterequi]AKK11835.1 hypothetical protein CUTER_09335 [Corynebacterium uterequi]